METFKQNILEQIAQFESGKIFSFRDLIFPNERLANVSVILSNQSLKGEIIRVEKGAYYKPQKSKLGLGKLPVYQDEQFRYITKKLDGYISGAYIYNKLGLTEQVATVITIATKNPVRQFKFKNLAIECVKAYSTEFNNRETLLYIRLLDAIKDIKRISGKTEQEVYDQIKKLYLKSFSNEVLAKVVSLAMEYPPRVRKILSDMLDDLNAEKLRIPLSKSILPTTRFELHYNKTSDLCPSCRQRFF